MEPLQEWYFPSGDMLRTSMQNMKKSEGRPIHEALFSIPSQVNWIHYELESKLKSYCFGLMETLSIGIKIENCCFGFMETINSNNH